MVGEFGHTDDAGAHKIIRKAPEIGGPPDVPDGALLGEADHHGNRKSVGDEKDRYSYRQPKRARKGSHSVGYIRSGDRDGNRSYAERDLDRFNFRRYELDAQQYVPFDNGYKVLAVASNVVLTDTDGNNTVPFYFMPDLGGRQSLRGFRERRFRDRNSIFASAEYRWEAWWALDVAVFADAGKVAARRSDINLKDLEGSYGMGFRFHTKKAFAFRLDIAHSREGFLPIFTAQHVF